MGVKLTCQQRIKCPMPMCRLPLHYVLCNNIYIKYNEWKFMNSLPLRSSIECVICHTLRYSFTFEKVINLLHVERRRNNFATFARNWILIIKLFFLFFLSFKMNEWKVEILFRVSLLRIPYPVYISATFECNNLHFHLPVYYWIECSIIEIFPVHIRMGNNGIKCVQCTHTHKYTEHRLAGWLAG